MLKSIRLAAVAAVLAFVTASGAIFAPAASAQATQFAPWEAKIVKPGDLYSTPEWSTDIDAALKAAGQGGRLEEIRARSNEKGWPATMSDFDKRIESPELIKAFRSHAIAKFRFSDNDVVMLHVSAAENGHMPDGWRPATDIYIIIRESGVAPR
jgi:hypothetical protein